MSSARFLPVALVALIAGFLGAALFAWSGLGARLGGQDVGEYLLANPEVLPPAIDELQRREMLARIEPMRADLETPFPGAVLGNPQGTVTLVEFSDYACGFCRSSLADVDQLIAANPDLKVVIREYPMLAPESADAARMALAAAQQQRFEQFHRAMFEIGAPTPEAITAAAEQAGLDLERAQAAIELGLFEGELQSNLTLGQQIGLTGTPSWIVGDQALIGAQGAERIGQAIDAARDS